MYFSEPILGTNYQFDSKVVLQNCTLCLILKELALHHTLQLLSCPFQYTDPSDAERMHWYFLGSHHISAPQSWQKSSAEVNKASCTFLAANSAWNVGQKEGVGAPWQQSPRVWTAPNTEQPCSTDLAAEDNLWCRRSASSSALGKCCLCCTKTQVMEQEFSAPDTYRNTVQRKKGRWGHLVYHISRLPA